MNKKIFIKHQIKSLLPFISILCVFLLIPTFFYGIRDGHNQFAQIKVDGHVQQVLFYPSSAFSTMGTIAVVFATLSPISILSYRTSLREQEFYRQSPIPKNKLLLIRLLIMSILFALAILLAVLVFLLAAKIDSKNYTEIYKAKFIFWKILVSYLMLTSAAIVQMIISCFFANFCNTNSTILFASVFGSSLITFGYCILMNYVEENVFFNIRINFDEHIPLTIFPGGYGIVKSHETLLSYSLTKGTVNYFTLFQDGNVSNLDIFVCIANIILPILFAAGAALYFFFQKEPSAEYAGKPKDRSIIPSIVFHAVWAIGFLYSTELFEFDTFLSYPFLLTFFVFYYLVNCARTKTMKVSINESIALVLGSIVPLGIGIIFTTIR